MPDRHQLGRGIAIVFLVGGAAAGWLSLAVVAWGWM